MSDLRQLHGRILDTDSHEFTPAGLWSKVFGESADFFAQFFLETHDPEATSSFSAPVDRDETPISADNMDSAWQQGAWAPGAFDMQRRVEVLDALGIQQAFIFPTGIGMLGLNCISAHPDRVKALFGTEIDPGVLLDVGRGLLDLHNNWCIEVGKIDSRLRPVAFIDTNDMRIAIEEAERVISSGVRAIGIASGIPPGGISPGHPYCDPLWDVFACSDVPLLLHAGGDFGVLRSATWCEYGMSNDPGRYRHPEIVLDPYSISQFNLGPQNFLTAAIFGGMFERHPTLRVGCIEVSAYWVGPMAENMKHVGRQFRRLTSHLSLTPAEYLQRNVRVSPFWWEPIDKYIERFEWLANVYVYGSDYPHFEGGKDPGNVFLSALEHLGPTAVEKFFVKNAELLMP